MKTTKTTSRYLALTAAICLACVATARAQMIGIDFSGFGTPLPSTTLAGVVPQMNWNNLSAASGSLTAGTIADSTGSTSNGLAASWGSNGSNTLYYFGGNSFSGANATGNTDLFSGSLLTFGPGAGSGYQGNITLTGITYATYDVYAYFEGSNGLVNLNGTPDGPSTAPYTFTGGTTVSFSSATPGAGNFVAADVGGDPANYALFSGVTGSSLTIYDQQGSSGGLVGIEIVNTAGVPEPSSYALMLAGLGIMAGFYRSRFAR